MFPQKPEGPLPRRGRSFDSVNTGYEDKQIHNEVRSRGASGLVFGSFRTPL
jgi:hypothetical protein